MYVIFNSTDSGRGFYINASSLLSKYWTIQSGHNTYLQFFVCSTQILDN